MKIYVVVTADLDLEGGLITYHKDFHLFKETAFSQCLKMDENTCVMEFEYSQSWNRKQIEEE